METSQSETGVLLRVLAKHPRVAFGSNRRIAAEWRALNFSGAPDLPLAIRQYDRFLELLCRSNVEVHELPDDESCGLDSIYVRDASVMSDRGAILCSMGKAPRAGEPAAQGRALAALGRPILGSIQPPARLEGGDVVWLGARTIAVGQGYRTDAEGIRQLRALLADAIDEMLVVGLPHWSGAGDVFHLMSIVSPVDHDLAVVYSRAMPVPFRERLVERGITLVEVPDEEFETMGANVLALAPRTCVMLQGNPITRARLERAGARVLEYEGTEISVKGGGGPTCLTRPLARRVTP